MKIRRIGKYFLLSVFTMFLILTLNFLLVYLMPGDSMKHILGEEEYYQLAMNRPDYLDELREEYGLKSSLGEQYITYLKNTLQFNFGFSYVRTQEVKTLIFSRLGWTLLLAVPATVIAAFAGGWLGLCAGWNLAGRMDKTLTPCFLLLNTIPPNCLSILVIVTLAFKAGWFPISGMVSGGLAGWARYLDIAWHMVLPLLVLVCYKVAANYIHMRSYVMEIRKEDYILTARSKGLSERKILKRHLLFNALPPYLIQVCMQFGGILSGTVMVEVAFSWKGMGTLMQESLTTKDYPTLQMCFLLMSFCVVVCNLAADIMQTVMDPRLKESAGYE